MIPSKTRPINITDDPFSALTHQYSPHPAHPIVIIGLFITLNTIKRAPIYQQECALPMIYPHRPTSDKTQRQWHVLQAYFRPRDAHKYLHVDTVVRNVCSESGLLTPQFALIKEHSLRIYIYLGNRIPK